MNLTVKIILGLFFGAIVGLLLNIFSPQSFEILNAVVFSPIGSLFINAITMLVVPIVLISITLGTAGLGDPKKLGRIGGKTILYFLSTTAFAITIGIFLALVIKPGNGGNFDIASAEYTATTAPSITETLINIIPKNPIQAMADGNMLQVIVMSIFFGIAITALGEKTKGLINLLEQGNEVLMYLVNLIMKAAPYATFALIATAVGSQGLPAIKNMGLYMIVVLLALLTHTIVTYGGAIAIFAKRNPIEFFKKFFPAMTVGFSTSSSSATLPVAMELTQKELSVPKSISSFVQPLGATINMDGTAIMQGVATVFIAQAYSVDLTMTQLITVILTAVLASIGTAGVPGVGLIMLTMVLGQVGLPVEGVGLILGIDRLLDMTRTAVNITGDASCAVIIAESEKKREKQEDIADTIEIEEMTA